MKLRNKKVRKNNNTTRVGEGCGYSVVSNCLLFNSIEKFHKNLPYCRIYFTCTLRSLSIIMSYHGYYRAEAAGVPIYTVRKLHG